MGARNRAAHRALSIAGDHAWEDMRAVQERFGKTDGVVALHAYQSLQLCPEKYLPIVEGVIDGAIKLKDADDEKEDV